MDHVSGANGSSGAQQNGTANGNNGSNGSVGNANSVSPPAPTTPRIPLNSGFNSMYASIPQPIATMAENYRLVARPPDFPVPRSNLLFPISAQCLHL